MDKGAKIDLNVVFLSQIVERRLPVGRLWLRYQYTSDTQLFQCFSIGFAFIARTALLIDQSS